MKENDDLETPQWLIKASQTLFGIQYNLDVCAHRDNVCQRFYTVLDDGLTQSWVHKEHNTTHAWCNPPYSRGNVEKWVYKACTESNFKIRNTLNESTITMLLPASTDTGWFDRLHDSKFDIWLITGRIVFDKNGVKTGGDGKFGSMIAHSSSRSCGSIHLFGSDGISRFLTRPR